MKKKTKAAVSGKKSTILVLSDKDLKQVSGGKPQAQDFDFEMK